MVPPPPPDPAPAKNAWSMGVSMYPGHTACWTRMLGPWSHAMALVSA